MTVDRPRRSGLFAPRSPSDDAPRRGLGPLAFALAVFFAVVTTVAVAVAAGGDYPTATTLAWFAIAGTAGSFVLGAAAAVLGRGRRWALAALVVSVVANPLLLRLILGSFDTTT